METHEVLEMLEDKCPECGKVFKTERALILHMESAHREEIIIKVHLRHQYFCRKPV